MKKSLLFTIIGVASVSFALGQSVSPRGPQDPLQHTQALSFVGSGPWMPGGTVTLDVVLTFSGYSSYGLSYWLEVPNSLAPHISITGVEYFTFLDPIQNAPKPVPFNSTSGSRPGYMVETRDLGAIINGPIVPGNAIPPGTYQISRLTFSLDATLPLGAFTLYSTSTGPRMSEVTDTDFNDNYVIPPGSFVVVVPEPSTFSFLLTSATGLGFLGYRRRQQKKSVAVKWS